jgi:hypothetical protein
MCVTKQRVLSMETFWALVERHYRIELLAVLQRLKKKTGESWWWPNANEPSIEKLAQKSWHQWHTQKCRQVERQVDKEIEHPIDTDINYTNPIL